MRKSAKVVKISVLDHALIVKIVKISVLDHALREKIVKMAVLDFTFSAKLSIYECFQGGGHCIPKFGGRGHCIPKTRRGGHCIGALFSNLDRFQTRGVVSK